MTFDAMINQIIFADCLPIINDMPDKCVDITVTSPPYNQLGKSRNNAKGWSTSKGMFENNRWRDLVTSGAMYDDERPEDEYQEWLNSILQELLRVTKGIVWINHKPRYRNGKCIHPLSFLRGQLFCELIWDRGGSMMLNCRNFAINHESIYGFGTRHYWNDESNKLMTVWKISPSQFNGHPCSFPLEIPERLIHASCPPEGTVFDPFCGSGITCIAAKKLGRRFIGIDQVEDYCNLALEGLEMQRESPFIQGIQRDAQILQLSFF